MDEAAIDSKRHKGMKEHGLRGRYAKEIIMSIMRKGATIPAPPPVTVPSWVWGLSLPEFAHLLLRD